ncbi:hypothetical protein CAL12_16865 [Bordetella genomosp. 8]|uniref:AB hydrolase-1 domain-containing protein n=1 Tax=Bordetella genomosp. 8 TaxID=1416806 RepID=A0A1W6YMM4_9BORD|nr:alpha/beta fold hydrolase [Bordetella genomosp. 8]ARP82322.1 hypothetical protein CAL12_16865 [Bordetella genomosp. 8]
MADMTEDRDAVPAWLDQTLFPFKNRWIDIDGNRIHYVDEGSGPTLLLLHGNGSWSFLYRHIITRLAPHFRCIAFDHAGFGLSRARPGFTFKPREHATVLEGLVRALSLRDIRLVVQDWGGPIGLSFAGLRPDLIDKLIICNTWAWPADGIKHIENWSRLTGGGLGRFLIVRYNALTRFLVPMSTKRRLTSTEKAAYARPYPTPASRIPHSQFAKEIPESRDFLSEVEAGLARLRDKPVLILWGDNDPGFRDSERQRFETEFPGAEVHVLTGAKHFVQEDAPAEICHAIEQFEAAHMEGSRP